MSPEYRTGSRLGPLARERVRKGGLLASLALVWAAGLASPALAAGQSIAVGRVPTADARSGGDHGCKEEKQQEKGLRLEAGPSGGGHEGECRGATGATGPAGPTGATGATGATGTISVTRVDGPPVTLPPNSSFILATATCPAGQTAISGGWNTSTPGPVPGASEQFPGTDAWSVSFDNPTATPSSAFATAYCSP